MDDSDKLAILAGGVGGSVGAGAGIAVGGATVNVVIVTVVVATLVGGAILVAGELGEDASVIRTE